jgi:hypothetical protein
MLMRSIRVSPVAALAFFLLAPTPALAAYVTVLVDGLSVGTIAGSYDPDGNYLVDNLTLTNPGFNPLDPNDTNNDWKITLGAFMDPDPQIIYGAVVFDFGAPSVFGFVFAQAIAATPAPGLVSHSESSSTTDPNANTTVVTAFAPPGLIPVDGDATTEQFVYTLSQDGGLSFLNAGQDIRASFVGVTPSDTQAAINLGPSVGPAGAGFYDYMRVDVNFSMNGGNDVYSFNGVAEVVPEPATAALFGLGLVGLAVAGRRRSA